MSLLRSIRLFMFAIQNVAYIEYNYRTVWMSDLPQMEDKQLKA